MISTNYEQIDFLLITLAPTSKRQTSEGWTLNWHYSNLISAFQIGVTMAEKLQPGPLSGEISFFAPVSPVLFSSTFFLKGFTGLSVTIGCIMTLFVAMQITARTRWSEL